MEQREQLRRLSGPTQRTSDCSEPWAISLRELTSLLPSMKRTTRVRRLELSSCLPKLARCTSVRPRSLQRASLWHPFPLQSGRSSVAISGSTMGLRKALCSLYASIAGGQIDRLKRRGHAEEDAEAETAFALTSCSMVNILTVLLAIEVPGLGHTALFYVLGIVLYFASQRLHRRLFRFVATWAKYSPKIWARRSAYSLAYPVASLSALGLVIAWHWAGGT